MEWLLEALKGLVTIVLNMFNTTINHNYNIDKGGILVVAANQQDADKIAEALGRLSTEREPEQVPAESNPVPPQ